MDSFCRDLITEWRRLGSPNDGETVVVAVSGGADSVSLLIALDELRRLGKLDLRIVAAHFNHHLRGSESDADEQFVRDLTTERKIELAVGSGRPAAEGNLEQTARGQRYEFLVRTAGSLHAAAILTGHTMNDQAETFLMNLIRGSGIQGLAGIRPVRQLEHTLLVRPLITWAKRIDTENFCRRMGIEFRYDSMNEDTAFRRVRIRKVLLPLLEDLNPKIVERLASTAALLADALDEKVSDASSSDPVLAESLPIEELVTRERAELYSTLRAWLAVRRPGGLRSITLKHIEAIARLIHTRRSGREVELPGGGRVVKSGGILKYEENRVEKPSDGH
ncbi:MAG: tRNA lysidine(34) synthetase TilS [Pyrinomonadaceae bacterium]